MRLTANPFDLVGADIEVSEGSLALIVSDHEIGEWPLDEVAIDSEVDGFHMRVDGEEFVFTTKEAAAFAEAVGISKAPAGSRKKTPRSTRAVKDSPVKAKAIRAPRPARAPSRQPIRKFLRRVDISNPRTTIAFVVAIAVVGLAIVARTLLAGMLLFTGMAGVLLIGAAIVDPLIATRLPDGWPTSRLVPIALTMIVSGLLLVAF